MGRQRFTPEQIIAKLREVDVIVGRGGTAVEACRQIGIAEQTLYCPSSEVLGQPGCGFSGGLASSGLEI